MKFGGLHVSMKDCFCLSMQDTVVELKITSRAVLSIPEISNFRLLDGLNKSLRVSTHVWYVCKWLFQCVH